MLRKKYLLNRTLIFYLSLFPSLFFLLCYLRLLLSEFYLSIIFHNYGNFFLLFFQAVSSIGKRILLVQFPTPNQDKKKLYHKIMYFIFWKKWYPKHSLKKESGLKFRMHIWLHIWQQSSLIYNTSARHERRECNKCNTNMRRVIRVQHEWDTSDTNATRMTRVRHEYYTSDTSATRVKNAWFW